jgi:hypothetical protein
VFAEDVQRTSSILLNVSRYLLLGQRRRVVLSGWLTRRQKSAFFSGEKPLFFRRKPLFFPAKAHSFLAKKLHFYPHKCLPQKVPWESPLKGSAKDQPAGQLINQPGGPTVFSQPEALEWPALGNSGPEQSALPRLGGWGGDKKVLRL